ncbi:hypothetical protein H0H81_008322 [Sphagnurus paluster]|uniref:ERT1/acuK family PAS domain-containing protein n=1 Tax=Sphagnurus paluster TaxID=117069 RepID=A0A9P7KKU8_9AGAR|nr:hypothetical protein H0H81_008322 [Sphagnurus paluster]
MSTSEPIQPTASASSSVADDAGKKKKVTKRRKVNHADFLETLDEGSFFSTPANTISSALLAQPTYAASSSTLTQPTFSADVNPVVDTPSISIPAGAPSSPAAAVLPSATKKERFLLTAADQESGSRNERLNRVIRSKYEAGLLKPYNYVKGYARLSRWMDSQYDLVFIEEAFERLLLDYDRVFAAMAVPACLWRRTGEIYKANREFAELVGLEGFMMRDGRLCIYELMAEESAVNYWEKYGHVAFDSSQKAVLTSCVLRYKPRVPGTHSNALNPNPNPLASPMRNKQEVTDLNAEPEENKEEGEDGFVNCCFSFTIRRDKWGIPTMIVGNFIRC